MKKISFLVTFFALMFVSLQVHAVTLGVYDRGVLVPSVYHDGANMDTVVGLICQETTVGCTTHDVNSKTNKTQIWWTFYDIDSNHVTDGVIPCTDDDFVGFSWKANSGRNLDKVEGYLVFATADSDFTISANAFLVDTAKKDAIFIPVIPLATSDLNTGFTRTNMQVVSLSHGIQGGTTVDVRYWMDPTYNAGTTMVIWLVDPLVDSKGKPIPQTILAYNTDEQAKSVTITLPHELNKIIPCNIPGLPLEYIDGFIQWTFPSTMDGFAYSYISSTLFGAQQTLLAAECSGSQAGSPPATCGCQGAGY